MSPWLYWPIFGLMILSFLVCLGVVQFVLWIAVVNLYTAWGYRAKLQLQRDPAYFAERVLGVKVVAPWQRSLLQSLEHQGSRRVQVPPVLAAPYGGIVFHPDVWGFGVRKETDAAHAWDIRGKLARTQASW